MRFCVPACAPSLFLDRCCRSEYAGIRDGRAAENCLTRRRLCSATFELYGGWLRDNFSLFNGRSALFLGIFIFCLSEEDTRIIALDDPFDLWPATRPIRRRPSPLPP
jgi:hypothetical protein